MLRLLFSCIILGSLFSSCIEYKYLNRFDSKEVTQMNDSFKFENKDLVISYDFSRRFMEFSIYNKSEKAIVIDWERSGITLNDSSFSYYQEDYDLSGFKNISYQGREADKTSIRVSSMDGPTSYLLPGSMRTVKGAKVLVKLMDADKRAARKKIKSKGIDIDTLSRARSPLLITNNIAYSFDQEMEPVQQVSNGFWLSEAALVRNSRYKEFYEDRQQPNSYLLDEVWVNGVIVAVAVGVPIVALAIFAASWEGFRFSIGSK